MNSDSVTDIRNLPKHITYYERKVPRPNGEVRVERSIRVFLKMIQDGQRKRISRTISVTQHGLDAAVAIAQEWLSQQQQLAQILERCPPTAPTFNWEQQNQRYITISSSIIVRVPGLKVVCFNLHKAEEALDYRDKQCAALGIDINRRVRRHERRPIRRTRVSIRKKHKFLPPGIYYSEYKFLGNEGAVLLRREYRSSIKVKDPDNGKFKSLSITRSINRYGDKEALRLVTEWRERVVAKYYYTPSKPSA